MNTRSLSSSLVVSVVAVLAALLLGGCAGGSRTVHGRVIAGQASVVTLVDAKDPRLETAGLGGVRVQILRPGTSAAPMAEATTVTDGSFSMKLTEQQAMSGRVEIIATGPGIVLCRGSVYVPSEEQRLLVFAETRRGSADGGGSR